MGKKEKIEEATKNKEGKREMYESRKKRHCCCIDPSFAGRD